MSTHNIDGKPATQHTGPRAAPPHLLELLEDEDEEELLEDDLRNKDTHM
jgi:hypothetical protein